MTHSVPKGHHRVFYLFVLGVVFGLWRLSHREETRPWPIISELGPQNGPAEPKPPDRENPTASAPEPAPHGHRYAIKWTDASGPAHVPHERRDLTWGEAMKVGWMAHHVRRYYWDVAPSASPFAELMVYLQCVCGRDVADLTRPHTIPADGGICPYSGPASAPERAEELLLA